MCPTEQNKSRKSERSIFSLLMHDASYDLALCWTIYNRIMAVTPRTIEYWLHRCKYDYGKYSKAEYKDGALDDEVLDNLFENPDGYACARRLHRRYGRGRRNLDAGLREGPASRHGIHGRPKIS